MKEKKERRIQKQLRKESLDIMMKEEGFDKNETRTMRNTRIKMRGESIDLEN